MIIFAVVIKNKCNMEKQSIKYQSDLYEAVVHLEDGYAHVRQRESVLEQWSSWERKELEYESEGYFAAMEKDLKDYLDMF